MATATMRELTANAGGSENAPPAAPNAPPLPPPPVNGSPFNPVLQSNGELASTMGRGPFATMDDLDRAFALPADGPAVVASLDDSGVAVVKAPVAEPAPAVTELVPVSGMAFDSVVVLQNVPAASNPTLLLDQVPPEEQPALVEPKRMGPPIRHNGQRRNVAAGPGDAKAPAIAEPGSDDGEPSCGAVVVPAVLLASWFAREWRAEEADARSGATVRR